jgi:hypothetical protein
MIPRQFVAEAQASGGVVQAKFTRRLAWFRERYQQHPDPLYIDGYIRGRAGGREIVEVGSLTEEALVIYLTGVFDGRDDARLQSQDDR